MSKWHTCRREGHRVMWWLSLCKNLSEFVKYNNYYSLSNLRSSRKIAGLAGFHLLGGAGGKLPPPPSPPKKKVLTIS